MKTIFIVLLVCMFTSCKEEPIEKYCGGIVVEKGMGPYWFRLKYNGKITDYIYVVEFDYNKYEVGDTIKCSTKDSLLYNTPKQ